jgi:UDP-N-acetyl-D-glucosamine dehydrogenase
MPDFVVEKVARALNDDRKAVNGSRVLVLGIAYKRDIDDMRESPALDIIRLLEGRGAHVSYHDPYVKTFTEDGHTMSSVPLTAETVKASDAVMIVTDHTGLDYGMIKRLASVVVDTRNALARVP